MNELITFNDLELIGLFVDILFRDQAKIWNIIVLLSVLDLNSNVCPSCNRLQDIHIWSSQYTLFEYLTLTLRLLSAGGPDINICNNLQSAGDTDRTLHEKTDRQPAVRLERYMKFGTASRRSGYTHRPFV